MRRSNWVYRLIIAAVAIFSLATPVIATADTKPIEQFYDQGPAVKNVGGYSGVLVDDTELVTNQLSNMVGFNFELSGKQKEAFVCRSYSDQNCSGANNVWYNAVLDFCKSSSETNCIAGISAIVNGREIVGKFEKNYPASSSFTFKGDASKNIPDGGLPTLFTFDGLKHDGGEQFMVYARYFHRGNIMINGTPNLAPQEFVAQVIAVSIAKNANAYEFNVKAQKADELGKAAYWDGANNGCVTSGINGECPIAWPLPKDVRFKLDVRTDIPLTSFMHGRLLDPTIKITNESSTRQIFSIEAGAVSVPILYTWVKNSDMPKALHDYLYAMPDGQWGGWFMYRDGLGNSRDNVQLRIPFDSYDEQRFKEYLWWLEVAKDKSYGNKTMWVARTLSETEIDSSGSKKCLSDQKNLTGIVTTNANMYISSPPVFNKEAQSLDYKVSSPHFDDAGKLNVGNYNLVLSSEAARCLYNFSKAPISATVSIVSADGTSQVATTTVNEKNGWLYLSANGFTYSAPTVRVKLTQEVDKPVATPSANASSQVTAAKKTTITCVKGKTSKKVTAAKPVCPAGFKKK